MPPAPCTTERRVTGPLLDAHLDRETLARLAVVDGQGDEGDLALGYGGMSRAVVPPEHYIVLVVEEVELEKEPPAPKAVHDFHRD